MIASFLLLYTILGDSLKTIRNVISRKARYCGEVTGEGTTQDSAVFFSWKETAGYKRAISRSERSALAAARSTLWGWKSLFQ